MDLSKEDKHKLEQTKQTFKIQELTKEQAAVSYTHLTLPTNREV